ncbi:ATPase family associated with various cellular activities (AAA) domain-containing protein [Trichoderma breve]|uniref:ATPase family associated with various cellular activities (AAA) domain-containing protein n=1 Tax=Trichoderma breve TaxID=2034170 RepID=A0A9W9E999_9HYPO|nr:ATPase family associated with various cellular activities (AAA) domain-containing protein [Trichoderma breve]KAJ4862909.1 ATPase family associated with various cellular activities (AAA) domain-containing protein [Trichoderma breve]
MAEPRFVRDYVPRDYDRRRPIVRDYDREDSMSDGFEELGPRSLLPNPRRLKYAVDGEVPEILYTLNHVNQNRHFIGRLRSSKPFENVTSYEIKDDETDEGGELIKKPIFEIVTNVCIEGRSIDNNRHIVHPRRVNPNLDRPITAAFDNVDYRSDGYYTEEEQYYDPPGTPQVETPLMVIYSNHLLNALRAVIRYYPNINLNGKSVQISAPYRVLYHHRYELSEYRDNQPDEHSVEYAETTAHHIDVLLKFLATFDYFWLLLKPGRVIYVKKFDIWTPLVISSVSIGNRVHGGLDNYRLSCWSLESNGAKVGRFMESVIVTPWPGEQVISSLSVIPADFWKDDLEAQGGLPMREKMIEEGKLYWELLKRPTYMEYDGLLVNSGSGSRLPGGATGFMNGRVICDASGFDKFFESSPDWDGRRYPQPHRRRVTQDRSRENDGPFVGFEDLDPLCDTPPDNDLFYFVLSKTIPGFILGTRRWGNLHVANLSPVKPDKEAFKYLVLDDDIKMTVRALIGQYTTGVDGQVAPWGNDFIRNKGEGRIFLLHGAPGVGKTCTAECIAELTNRPLISLTSGDLSVDSFRVESNLNYFLELGQRYGALVLLDEADVYLERRRAKNISRNGLVSVFLRALEYYRGVLFLTTNRVRSFDTAFLSRIHVALHYKNLGDEERERIWTHNFDRLDRDSRGKIRVAIAAREFVWSSQEVRALKWNGREIRNAMQTALALAESDSNEEGLQTITIGEKHIRAVVKMSKGFKDYIKSVGPLDSDDVDYDGDGDDEAFNE